jgi:hypothetical protein
MSTLLMLVDLPQNMAVPAKFCYLSSRGMFIGNVGLNKTRVIHKATVPGRSDGRQIDRLVKDCELLHKV